MVEEEDACTFPRPPRLPRAEPSNRDIVAGQLKTERRLQRIEQMLNVVATTPPPRAPVESAWMRRAKVAAYAGGVMAAGLLAEFVRGIASAIFGW